MKSDEKENLLKELNSTTTDPILPIEKKLVAFSVGLGLLFLFIFYILNYVILKQS